MSAGKVPGVASARPRDKIDPSPTDDTVRAFDPAMSPPVTDEEAASPHDEEGLSVARKAGHRDPSPKP
jgi:hypothetical protein